MKDFALRVTARMGNTVKKELLYFWYDIYRYDITARISGTTYTCMLSQLVFQVRHIHVCYNSSISGTTYRPARKLPHINWFPMRPGSKLEERKRLGHFTRNGFMPDIYITM
jgi:hypothetical protein